MAQISKVVVDSAIRSDIFNALNLANMEGYFKVNDRQYGTIVTDANGVERYVRIGIIVAEEREDISARELMGIECAKYNDAQEKKAQKKAEAAEKAVRDRERRERKAAEKAAKQAERAE